MGEYNHLHMDLENEPPKFFDGDRMTQGTFRYILNSKEKIIDKGGLSSSVYERQIQPKLDV